ncbi:hypothetical protein, partial [Klebsiella pneumoniae]
AYSYGGSSDLPLSSSVVRTVTRRFRASLGITLPLEVLYTIVPFLVIGVLFFYTVRTENKVLDKNPDPQHVVNVVGQKWS